MDALPQVLLIDDDVAVRKAVEFRLRGMVRLTACHSASGALEAVKGNRFDAALVDVNLGPGMSGTQLISGIREADPDLAAIIFTAHSNYETALESFGAHSFDFIPKSLRDDRTFCAKIAEAVERTREQRSHSRGAADAIRLRSELAEAVVGRELEITTGDIQRGLIGESLATFSSLLGQVELLDLYLSKLRQNVPGIADAAKLSQETVAELQDYVGKLRDYFAEPQRSNQSVNEVISHAARVLQEGAQESGGYYRVEHGQLSPDQAFGGDSRALLRAIVVLARLLATSGTAGSVVTINPSLVINPLLDINLMKSAGHVLTLRTANFCRDDRTAVAIGISGPRGGMTAEKIAGMFSAHSPASGEAPPWSALAMVEKVKGALTVELRSGVSLTYRIIFKV